MQVLAHAVRVAGLDVLDDHRSRVDRAPDVIAGRHTITAQLPLRATSARDRGRPRAGGGSLPEGSSLVADADLTLRVLRPCRDRGAVRFKLTAPTLDCQPHLAGVSTRRKASASR